MRPYSPKTDSRVVFAIDELMRGDMKIVVVIPCRNESKHIGKLVRALIGKGYTVVVSDDYSSDLTPTIAHMAGADVVNSSHVNRHGYGATLLRGIQAAVLMYAPDVFVFMDGDSQHSPDDIANVLRPILRDRADVVLGSRLGKQDKRPYYRRLSNAFGTWIANVGVKQKVTDAITGYWAIRTSFLPSITEKGWGASFENLMKSRAAKARIISVPVQALWHNNSRDNSTLNPVLLGSIVIWKIIKWRFLCEARPIRLARWISWQAHKRIVYPDYGK